jgi:hypothetical protein
MNNIWSDWIKIKCLEDDVQSIQISESLKIQII